MGYEYHNTSDDQVRLGRGQACVGSGPSRPAGVFLYLLQEDLHPASTLRHAGCSPVPQDRLSRHGAAPQGLVRTAKSSRTSRPHSRSLHPPKGRRPAAKKKSTDALLSATVTTARQQELIPKKSRAAADSTGYEARAVSGYFAFRAGRRIHQKRWPKLTVVIDTQSHLYLSARVTRGPSQDAPHLIPAARDAVRNTPIDLLLGDAAYDSEDNHATP